MQENKSKTEKEKSLMYEKIFEDQLKSNIGQVAGTIVSKPVFSHQVYGENFYEFLLEITRLSGQADTIPITLGERLIADKNMLEMGNQFAAIGEYRSYNQLLDGKSRLMLTFFAKNVLDNSWIEKMNTNLLKLSGYICKPPVFRTTPFNREICDLLVAVNRQYSKSDYIPCIAWGRNARFATNFEIGQKINIEGRIQSRVYVKQVDGEQEERTAYEVSIQKLELENASKAESYFSANAVRTSKSDSEAS